MRCGYATNLAAFSFHHREPATKLFQLDLRSLSNRTLEVIRQEAAKCDLVCANCHAELHHPQLNTNNFDISTYSTLADSTATSQSQ